MWKSNPVRNPSTLYIYIGGQVYLIVACSKKKLYTERSFLQFSRISHPIVVIERKKKNGKSESQNPNSEQAPRRPRRRHRQRRFTLAVPQLRAAGGVRAAGFVRREVDAEIDGRPQFGG